jgi:hypothetical protein
MRQHGTAQPYPLPAPKSKISDALAEILMALRIPVPTSEDFPWIAMLILRNLAAGETIANDIPSQHTISLPGQSDLTTIGDFDLGTLQFRQSSSFTEWDRDVSLFR